MKHYINELIKWFDVKYNPTLEWVMVHCPYHDDSRKSAGINFKTNFFNCFVCGNKTLKQLHTDLFGEKMTEKKNETQLQFNIEDILKLPKPKLSDEEILGRLKQLIEEKKLTREIIQKLKATPVLNYDHSLFGYLGFPFGDGKYVARKFIPEVAGPKWLNSNGEKPPLYIVDDSAQEIILVEGFFDATALMSLGFNNVAVNGGGTAGLTAARLYPLKGKVVYILFDNDFAGFTGTEKAYQVLKNIRAHPIALELPKEYGKDPNEALNHPKFETWIKKQLQENYTADTLYLNSSDEALYVLPTPFPTLNQYLIGGYRPGVHSIAGEPGVGKSATMLYQVAYWVEKFPELKALYVTYEISKRQCWSRLTSIYTKNLSWVEIETGNVEIEEEAIAQRNKLAQRLKVSVGLSTSEIVRAMNEYNIVVIDYIQAMQGSVATLTETMKTSISRDVRELGNLARDKEKFVFILSSVPRSAYAKDDLSIFKECGDIEFASQSCMKIKDINHGGEKRVLGLIILKNTRGQSFGELWIEGNMLHNSFIENGPV